MLFALALALLVHGDTTTPTTDPRLEALAHELESSDILKNPTAVPFTREATQAIRIGNLRLFMSLLDNLQDPASGYSTKSFLSPDQFKHFYDEAVALRYQLVKEKHVQIRHVLLDSRATLDQARKPEDLNPLLLKLPVSTDVYDGTMSRYDELNEKDRQAQAGLRNFTDHYRLFLSLIQADNKTQLAGSYRDLCQENSTYAYVAAAHLRQLFTDATAPQAAPLWGQVDAIVDQLVADGDYDKALTALRPLSTAAGSSAIQDLIKEINGYSSFLNYSIPYPESLDKLTSFMDACNCEPSTSAWTPKLQPLYRQLIAQFILANAKLQDYPAIDPKRETVVAYLHRMLDLARKQQKWADATQFLGFLFIYGDNYHTRMSYFQNEDVQSMIFMTNALDRQDQKRYAEAMENGYLALSNARTYGPGPEAQALFKQLVKNHPDDYVLIDAVLHYHLLTYMKSAAADMRDQWSYLVPTL